MFCLLQLWKMAEMRTKEILNYTTFNFLSTQKLGLGKIGSCRSPAVKFSCCRWFYDLFCENLFTVVFQTSLSFSYCIWSLWRCDFHAFLLWTWCLEVLENTYIFFFLLSRWFFHPTLCQLPRQSCRNQCRVRRGFLWKHQKKILCGTP